MNKHDIQKGDRVRCLGQRYPNYAGTEAEVEHTRYHSLDKVQLLWLRDTAFGCWNADDFERLNLRVGDTVYAKEHVQAWNTTLVKGKVYTVEKRRDFNSHITVKLAEADGYWREDRFTLTPPVAPVEAPAPEAPAEPWEPRLGDLVEIVAGFWKGCNGTLIKKVHPTTDYVVCVGSDLSRASQVVTQRRDLRPLAPVKPAELGTVPPHRLEKRVEQLRDALFRRVLHLIDNASSADELRALNEYHRQLQGEYYA